MEFDMDKAIKECENHCTENDEIAFALGAGRIAPKLGKIKEQKKAIKFICGLDGFLGVYLVDTWHTLLIFDTLNHAKAARNILKEKMYVGQVAPLVVNKAFNEYAKEYMGKWRNGNKEEGV